MQGYSPSIPPNILRKNKRSSNVIHVTVLSTNNNKSINHHQRQQNNVNILSINQISQDRKKDFCFHNNHLHIKTKKIWDDKPGAIQDFHKILDKNTKKKYIRRVIIGILIAVLVLILIIMTILLILFLQPKKTKINTTTNPVLNWNPMGITIAGVSGVAGITNDKLNLPYDAIVDYSNTLYIAEWGNNRVQKYIKDASSGTTIAGQANGSISSAQNYLYNPARVLPDLNGDIFVVDVNNNRIQFWANGASTGTTVAGNSGGISGGLNNLLWAPFGIVKDTSTGTLYISDYGNHRIMSYTSGASTGVVVAGGNGQGLGNNNTQLNYPSGLYFDSLSNSLIIANNGAKNIIRWVLGDSSWTLLAGDSGGLAGNTSTLFRGPRDVTLDPMGNIFVADRDNHRIQFFPVGQSTGMTIAGMTGMNGTNSSLLHLPRSIKLDNQLNLYVADTSNHRIQKFLRC